jgi:dual specificity tyrosine-phosphorylation-regulated kinase 2/3/4
MSAAAALRTLGHVMTLYERAEILQYHEIFFAGRSGAAKIRGSALSCEPNHGFDDARGEYLPVAGDHVAYRYEVQSVLGRGSFGQVLRCVDHATGGAVALKIIRNKRRFQRQAVVEAGILGALARRDPDGAWGAVRMLDSFTFRCHLCITFELLSINLYELIKSNNFVGCSPDLVRRVARQVLRTLSHLRRLDLVHCDLKPENILLVARGSSEVRVIDFGSSCYSDQRVFT